MSWHDSARTLEADADSALREEMRSLLGMGPRNDFEAEHRPELMLLADDLRREAQRRNRTTRKQHSWMLMAAALPFALVLTGVGAWGISQKHKADGYAAAIAQKEAEIQRLAGVVKAQPGPAPSTEVTPGNLQLARHAVAPKPRSKGKELIIPVERAPEPLATGDTQRVKGH